MARRVRARDEFLPRNGGGAGESPVVWTDLVGVLGVGYAEDLESDGNSNAIAAGVCPSDLDRLDDLVSIEAELAVGHALLWREETVHHAKCARGISGEVSLCETLCFGQSSGVLG